MAFSSSVTTSTIAGNKRLVFGTFTNADTDSGGSITTGLKVVDWFGLFPTSHVGATDAKVTISAGTVTLVTDNGLDGTWMAIGV